VLSLVQETENLHNAYDKLEDAFFDARENHTTQIFHANTRPALLKTLYEELQFWEHYASESDGFIAGGQCITLADCAFYPLLGYMLRRGFEFNKRWQGLKRYHELMWERDSVKKAQPEG
jgi:glutathione S-transferase